MKKKSHFWSSVGETVIFIFVQVFRLLDWFIQNYLYPARTGLLVAMAVGTVVNIGGSYLAKRLLYRSESRQTILRFVSISETAKRMYATRTMFVFWRWRWKKIVTYSLMRSLVGSSGTIIAVVPHLVFGVPYDITTGVALVYGTLVLYVVSPYVFAKRRRDMPRLHRQLRVRWHLQRPQQYRAYRTVRKRWLKRLLPYIVWVEVKWLAAVYDSGELFVYKRARKSATHAEHLLRA